MTASEFTDAQKASLVEKRQEWAPDAEVSRETATSGAYFNWTKKRTRPLSSPARRRWRELVEDTGWLKKIGAGLLLPCLLSCTAHAQERSNNTLEKAGDIAAQPARDIGLDKGEIPQVLQEAIENPYAPLSSRRCSAINVALGELNAILGEDFTAGAQTNENRAGKIAEAVGRTIVNSLIPFRGLVREISGAAPAERRLQAAVTAGIARRGYLRGMASANGCKIAPVPPPPAESSSKEPEGKEK